MTDLLLERDDLLFYVRRSVRYHNRRRAFFERLNNTSTAFSLTFSSATIYGVLALVNPIWPILAAAVVTVVSTVDLVIGSTKMARLHHDLARRFIAIEREITLVIHEPPRADQISTWKGKCLEIECDEPPIARVVDALCHNELCEAFGHSQQHMIKVAWYQRMFANFVQLGKLKRPQEDATPAREAEEHKTR